MFLETREGFQIKIVFSYFLLLIQFVMFLSGITSRYNSKLSFMARSFLHKLTHLNEDASSRQGTLRILPNCWGLPQEPATVDRVRREVLLKRYVAPCIFTADSAEFQWGVPSSLSAEGKLQLEPGRAGGAPAAGELGRSFQLPLCSAGQEQHLSPPDPAPL